MTPSEGTVEVARKEQVLHQAVAYAYEAYYNNINELPNEIL